MAVIRWTLRSLDRYVLSTYIAYHFLAAWVTIGLVWGATV